MPITIVTRGEGRGDTGPPTQGKRAGSPTQRERASPTQPTSPSRRTKQTGTAPANPQPNRRTKPRGTAHPQPPLKPPNSNAKGPPQPTHHSSLRPATRRDCPTGPAPKAASKPKGPPQSTHHSSRRPATRGGQPNPTRHPSCPVLPALPRSWPHVRLVVLGQGWPKAIGEADAQRP